ncbi:MAG: trimeric intracellular cation channel family protein [Thermoguttaceae bacterium]|nr:trimeric intracellular cation channel family protein [Thermoguttaceae bacterium]MBR5758282.1 trimeric intracellular cation channel family protein [Thermoguttaceae bacterium]
MTPILHYLEIIGTVAFAISGAVVGVEKKMDIFGVCILGVTTAVGGGILRDLILNISPPAAFRNPSFALTSVLVSILTFIPSFRNALEYNRKTYDNLMLVMDSIGLGLFTVVGVQTALVSEVESNAFLATFVGALTGVGGGLMRDVFAGDSPYIFAKDFYACASIIGATACVLLWPVAGESAAMLLGASATIILRLLAAKYRWSLPKAQ